MMINTHKDHADGNELIRKCDIYDILDNDYLVADRKEERLRGLKGVELNTDGDLISRADAIEAIVRYVTDGYAESADDFDGYIGAIKSIPSAQPKRGEWIDLNEKWTHRYRCSLCGHKLFEVPTRFCPNCGAKMEEDE